MSLPTQPVVARDGTITVEDNTGTPIVATAIYENGDFSIEGLTEAGLEVQEFRDRGQVYGLRGTDDKILDFSFSFDVTDITDTAAHVIDAFRKTGAFASGVSTWGANVSDPWTVKVKLALERTDAGGSADRTVTLQYCRAEMAIAEGNPMRCTVKGRAFPKGGTQAAVIA
jgi:hypothetical protein